MVRSSSLFWAHLMTEHLAACLQRLSEAPLTQHSLLRSDYKTAPCWGHFKSKIAKEKDSHSLSITLLHPRGDLGHAPPQKAPSIDRGADNLRELWIHS